MHVRLRNANKMGDTGGTQTEKIRGKKLTRKDWQFMCPADINTW